MSDRLNEIEALAGFLGSDTITNGSQAHVALADLVTFAREVEALHKPFDTQIDGRDTTSCSHCLELDNVPGDQPWDYTWPCPTAAAIQRLGGA